MENYITTKELAAALKMRPNTLERQRTHRDCPVPWTKFGGRVLYAMSDVQEYLKSQTRDRVNLPTAKGGNND